MKRIQARTRDYAGGVSLNGAESDRAPAAHPWAGSIWNSNSNAIGAGLGTATRDASRPRGRRHLMYPYDSLLKADLIQKMASTMTPLRERLVLARLSRLPSPTAGILTVLDGETTPPPYLTYAAPACLLHARNQWRSPNRPSSMSTVALRPISPYHDRL